MRPDSFRNVARPSLLVIKEPNRMGTSGTSPGTSQSRARHGTIISAGLRPTDQSGKPVQDLEDRPHSLPQWTKATSASRGCNHRQKSEWGIHQESHARLRVSTTVPSYYEFQKRRSNTG